MAIDRNRTRAFLEEMDELFGEVAGTLSEETRSWLKQMIMGPALKELRDLVEGSRAPKIFLVGCTRHGKSSVINALAGKEVAAIGHVTPTTPEAFPYLIQFPETFSTWEVIDTRGIFESTRPDQAVPEDAVRVLRNELLTRKPDVILHVISAPEVGNQQKSFEVMGGLRSAIKGATGGEIPILVVLNKADILGDPDEWPPEGHARKAAQIKEALDYTARDVLGVEKQQLVDLNTPIRGYALEGSHVLYIIPACALEGRRRWNIEVLSDVIGEELPKDARLDFYQAQQRKELLRKLSTSVIKRFATIAGAIGSSPIPVADIFVLTPLQILLIAIVGGLSCRAMSRETALEFAAASGVNIGGGIGLRVLAQQLAKLIPVAGLPVSAAIAAAGTYGIGRAAEAYFFADEIRKPEDFTGEWK